MFKEIRVRSRNKEVLEVPNLMRLQRDSYNNFLQPDTAPEKRKKQGLEALLRETFPIESYDKSISLDYLYYTLGRPRYGMNECRKLRLTYGAPFKIRVRLNLPNKSVEEDVYLGEIPLMIGGGEFVVNGAERVIVSQLHRSPGIDFSEDLRPGEKLVYTCRIIPERGSWIEVNTGRKDELMIRIDQSGKIPATMFLRALGEEYSDDASIVRAFHETEKVSTSAKDFAHRVKGKHTVTSVPNPEDAEKMLLDTGDIIDDAALEIFRAHKIRSVEYLPQVKDLLVLNTLAEDPSGSHDEALLRIYMRLRPGSPPHKDKAVELFGEKFFNNNKYRLGKVGRFRINRKLGLDVPQKQQSITPLDFAKALEYILKLRAGTGEIDDIDHLGNRQVRTIDELAGDEFRKGFLKLKRTVQERMSIMEQDQLTPRAIINSKTVSSSIDFFFGRSELSQVVDQHNPLAQLTHERRLSALGPGGLNRKRAGFEVRDVHISHYGRICPIETPEGTNIGLISSLAVFSQVDEYGFLTTPYRRVKNGAVKDEIVYLRADEEHDKIFAPADTDMDKNGKIAGSEIMGRINGDFVFVSPQNVEFIDVSPKQLVGVSAALIPFLEHNDANRALMGSNMQRQAVPLVSCEPPLVSTGMESVVAVNSGMVVVAEESGAVDYVDADRIVIGERTYEMRKFVGLNERTCLNQKPLVKEGEKVRRGQIIADGASTREGELSLGRNVLVAFMPWDGYNFEDAILVSESLIKRDFYTSVHIDEFEVEIRETKLGREEFTREIPNVSERALRNLDEEGIIRVGTKVGPGDILVGKVVPKSKSELSPEEKLLHAIFGRAGEDVKNDSLEVPSGTEGIVMETQKFSRKFHLSEEDRQADKQQISKIEKEYESRVTEEVNACFTDVEALLPRKLTSRQKEKILDMSGGLGRLTPNDIKEALDVKKFTGLSKAKAIKAAEVIEEHTDAVEYYEEEKNREINKLLRGDELPTGVLELVKVSVATKRTLSVGDKMAGRHGNKGVIAKILPEEDMPFLEDGTPVEMLLNPLGVPSRMNLGQILETHLGWAAKRLGIQAVTPIFDGYTESDIVDMLKEAGLPEEGQVTLYDGRTGERFAQKVTVGYLYMMKLHHLVDDKVHARATGPYSLITQQPLGGKARFGGQRFGEMEVWALEAYGAANVLQELLTVKSDDVDGRTKIYESMVKGENTLDPGTPVSFEVLVNEVRGLALNMQLHRTKPEESVQL
jgi:DNA-directed RNA polymerase subunit beta